MSVFRPWRGTGKRAVVDYDNFVAQSAQDHVICINGGVLAVVRKLVRERGLWRTTYAVSRSASGYTIPNDSEFVVIERKLAEFLEGTNEVEMCNQNLIDALSSIATAGAAGGGCGCGSGDAGSENPEPSSQQVDPPGTPGGTVPPGFDDLAEYETYKCDVANWIVDQMRADVVWWSNASISTMTLAIFIGLMLLPVPGARVVALLAAVVGLSGLGASVFVEFLQAIDDGRDDIVCALYNAENATDALADYITEMETAIDTATADTVFRYAIKMAFNLMTSNFVINKLFVEDAFTDFGTGDCTDCGVAQWWDSHLGTPVAWGSDWVDMLTVSKTPGYWAGIVYNTLVDVDLEWEIVGTPAYVGTTLTNDTVWENYVPDVGASAGGDPGSWDNGEANMKLDTMSGVVWQLRCNLQSTVRFKLV